MKPPFRLLSLLFVLMVPAQAQEESPKSTSVPESVKETARRAAELFSRGEWKESRELYEEVVKAAPGNALMRSNLGSAHFQEGDYEKAAVQLRKALEINPGLTPARITLGLALSYDGKAYLAISEMARAVHEKPEDPRAHSYLAILFREMKWVDAAESQLLKAIELNPRFAEAHYNLAVIYLDRNPVPLELVRRHYYRAIEMGSKRDKEIEKVLNVAND